MDKTVRIADVDRGHDTLIGGAFALTLSVIIVKIIGFFYKLPLSHILGDEGMGYFNSAYSIFTFFYMLCTGGIPRAVSITVTESLSKGNRERARRILGVSLKVYVSIGIIFSLVLMLFSSLLAELIGNSLSAFSLFCIAPSLSFVAASGVLRGYLNGRMRMREIAFSEVLEGAVKFVFGLAFALLGARHRLPVYTISALTILGVTLGSLVGAVFLAICFKSEKNEYKTEQKNLTRENNIDLIRSVFKISLPIMVSSMVMGISNIADLGLIMKRLISSGISSEEAIALYGNFTTLAVPLLNLVVSLISPLGASAIPHLTGKFASGTNREFEEISRVVLTVLSLVQFPISAAYFYFSEEILMLLFPDSSAAIGAPLLAVTSISVISVCSLTVINSILEATFHPKIPLISMSIGALLKIVFGYVLIGKLGIIGAPISTAICYTAAFVISLVLATAYAKIKVPFAEISFVPLLASFISVGGARLLYDSIYGGAFSIVKFIICSLLAAIFYAVIIFTFMRKNLISALNYVKIAKKH